ncbi:MAG: hypothetical protein LBR07_05255 [Puniceicoccales bacterium]|jgi:hypothetical protein|nr:hypothetical protein [Puniceicoccales bacterium]
MPAATLPPLTPPASFLTPIGTDLGQPVELDTLPGNKQRVVRRYLVPDTLLHRAGTAPEPPAAAGGVAQSWDNPQTIADHPLIEKVLRPYGTRDHEFPVCKLVEQHVRPIAGSASKNYGGKAILEWVFEQTPYARAARTSTSGGITRTHGEMVYCETEAPSTSDIAGYVGSMTETSHDQGRVIYAYETLSGEGLLGKGVSYRVAQSATAGQQGAPQTDHATKRWTFRILTSSPEVPTTYEPPAGAVLLDDESSVHEINGKYVHTLVFEKSDGQIRESSWEWRGGEGKKQCSETVETTNDNETDEDRDAKYLGGWQRDRTDSGFRYTGTKMETDNSRFSRSSRKGEFLGSWIRRRRIAFPAPTAPEGDTLPENVSADRPSTWPAPSNDDLDAEFPEGWELEWTPTGWEGTGDEFVADPDELQDDKSLRITGDVAEETRTRLFQVNTSTPPAETEPGVVVADTIAKWKEHLPVASNLTTHPLITLAAVEIAWTRKGWVRIAATWRHYRANKVWPDYLRWQCPGWAQMVTGNDNTLYISAQVTSTLAGIGIASTICCRMVRKRSGTADRGHSSGPSASCITTRTRKAKSTTESNRAKA